MASPRRWEQKKPSWRAKDQALPGKNMRFMDVEVGSLGLQIYIYTYIYIYIYTYIYIYIYYNHQNILRQRCYRMLWNFSDSKWELESSLGVGCPWNHSESSGKSMKTDDSMIFNDSIPEIPILDHFGSSRKKPWGVPFQKKPWRDIIHGAARSPRWHAVREIVSETTSGRSARLRSELSVAVERRQVLRQVGSLEFTLDFTNNERKLEGKLEGCQQKWDFCDLWEVKLEYFTRLGPRDWIYGGYIDNWME